jgi:hypothetical protein
VVVSAGLTLVVPVADDEVKFPGMMEIVVAKLVDQLNVLLDPELRLAGDAVKAITVGGASFGPPVAEVLAAHPASPTQATRIRASAQISREPFEAHLGSATLLQSINLRESMPAPSRPHFPQF